MRIIAVGCTIGKELFVYRIGGALGVDVIKDIELLTSHSTRDHPVVEILADTGIKRRVYNVAFIEYLSPENP